MENQTDTSLEKLIDTLQAIDESLQQIRQHQMREALRQDHFQHKLIALEASLDEKLGLWESTT